MKDDQRLLTSSGNLSSNLSTRTSCWSNCSGNRSLGKFWKCAATTTKRKANMTKNTISSAGIGLSSSSPSSSYYSIKSSESSSCCWTVLEFLITCLLFTVFLPIVYFLIISQWECLPVIHNIALESDHWLSCLKHGCQSLTSLKREVLQLVDKLDGSLEVLDDMRCRVLFIIAIDTVLCIVWIKATCFYQNWYPAFCFGSSDIRFRVVANHVKFGNLNGAFSSILS